MPRSFSVTAAICIAFTSSLSAQWPAHHPPASSPYWWTLTPEIKPQELRRILLDRDRHKERYLKAVELLEADPLSEEALTDLSYYVNGKLNPELVRFSYALEAFNIQYGKEDEEIWKKHDDAAMREHGISDSGRALIFSLTETSNREKVILMEELSVLSHQFVDILRQADAQTSKERLKVILKGKDLKELSRISGRPLKEVRELAEAWERDPAEEVYLKELETLKEELSVADWEGFRTFLYHELAPESVITGFDSELVEDN